MKKNRLDQLISAAFGDEGVELGRLTENEQKQFDSMRSISDGLKGLREVPECQLSNERLRNAILSGAVRKRGFSGWGLATATVVCSALVVLALQARYRSAPEQPVATNDARSAPAVVKQGDTAPKVTEPKTDMTAEKDPPIVDTSVPETRVASNKEPKSHDEASATASAAESVVPDYMRFTGRSPSASDITPVSFTGSNVHIEFPSDVQPTEGDHSAVVVVDADKTNSNGAYKATEVTSYGDVVFGG